MLIFIALASIFIVTFIFWRLDKSFALKVCPICAGVSLTWLGLLGAAFLGYEIDFLVPAILMGGSTVGMAYQLEKRLRHDSAGWRTPLIWKTLFVPAGFAAVYFTLSGELAVAAGFLLLLLVLPFFFLEFPKGADAKQEERLVEELVKKMKQCC